MMEISIFEFSLNGLEKDVILDRNEMITTFVDY